MRASFVPPLTDCTVYEYYTVDSFLAMIRIIYSWEIIWFAYELKYYDHNSTENNGHNV